MQFLSKKHDKRVELWLNLFFYAAFLLLAWLYVVRPLADPDFWWHLKTGEVIVRNQALLTADPFAFTGDGVVSLREKLILQGYWLWQVLFYSVYSTVGFDGVTLLEGLTLASLLFVMVYRMSKERVHSSIIMLLLAAGFILFTRMYFLERPQVFSFLFSAILVGMFEAIRRGERPSWLLYPLMTLWANCHAGFFFGDLLLLVFCAGACWEYKSDREQVKALLLWTAGGLLASLCSPTTFYAFYDMFDQSNKILQDNVIEYRSTFWFFRYSDKFIVVLWALLLSHVGVLFKSSKRYIPDILLFILISGLCLMYNRMTAFYLVALIPGFAFYLNKIEFKNLDNIHRIFMILAIIFVIYGCYREYESKGIVKYGNIELGQNFYPDKAAEFIKTSNLSGNIFNDYDWGGYLIWKLSPSVKVFYDGRCLDVREYKEYFLLEAADKNKTNSIDSYKYLLDKYKIDYVLQKHVLMYGGIQPLMKAFINTSGWIPVYLDENSYIFVRATSNAETIKKYGMDKSLFIQNMLEIYHHRIEKDPENPYNYLTHAGLLAWLGRYPEAQSDVLRARVLLGP